ILSVDFKPRGLENRAVALVTTVTHRLQWSDESIANTSSSPTIDELAAAARAVAMGKHFEFPARFEFPAPARMGRDFPSYSAVIEGEIRIPEIVAEVPVEAGRKSVRQGITV